MKVKTKCQKCFDQNVLKYFEIFFNTRICTANCNSTTNAWTWCYHWSYVKQPKNCLLSQIWNKTLSKKLHVWHISIITLFLRTNCLFVCQIQTSGLCFQVLLICSVLFGFNSGNRTLINLFGLGRTVKHYFVRSLVCLSCTSYTSRFHQVASKSIAQTRQIQQTKVCSF